MAERRAVWSLGLYRRWLGSSYMEDDKLRRQLVRSLRRAGFREFSDRHDGFVVEPGSDSDTFVIATTEPESKEPARRLASWVRASAGYIVEAEAFDDDPQYIVVRRR